MFERKLELQEDLVKLKSEIKISTLDKIIEKIVISKGWKQYGGQNSEKIISQKVDKYLKGQSQKLSQAANTLFGLSLLDFRNLVLVPQAERELLEEKFKAESRDFGNWLKNQKAQANVTIFTKEYRWTGEKIEK